jgi:hypothetical protein
MLIGEYAAVKPLLVEDDTLVTTSFCRDRITLDHGEMSGLLLVIIACAMSGPVIWSQMTITFPRIIDVLNKLHACVSRQDDVKFLRVPDISYEDFTDVRNSYTAKRFYLFNILRP